MQKKKNMSLVSVLIPAYNSEKYLEKTLDSVLKSTFKDFEVIIIDDASTDKTLEIAKKYSKKDSRVKVLHNEKNLGAAKSLNSVLAKIKSKYFTRLDSDDIIHPTKLEKQFNFLEKNPLKFCSTNINLIDEKGKLTKSNHRQDLNVPLRFAAIFNNPVPNAPIMYSMNIVRKNKIHFEELTAAEDYGFLLKYLSFSDGIMLNEPLYDYRIRKNSLYHSNQNYATEKSLILSQKYLKKIAPNFLETKLFKTLNTFNEFHDELSDEDIRTILEEGEKLINIFAKKYNLDFKDILNCRIFLFKLLHEKLAERIESGYGMKTPIRTTFHYLKHNGTKKTILKIRSKLFRKNRN